MPRVETPDGKTIDFPDSMKMDEIQGILDREYPKSAPKTQEPPNDKKQYISQEPQVRAAFNEYGRPVIEGVGLGAGAVVGAAAGGTSGSVIPGAGTAVGAAYGGVAGASLGYSMSKRVGDIVENFIYMFEKPTAGMTPERGDLTDEIKKKTVESLKDLRDGAMIQMLGETGAAVIVNPIAKILAPYREQFIKSGAANINKTAEKFGIKLSPAEQIDSKGLGLIESALQKSPASADIGREWINENQVLPLMRQRNELLSNPMARGEDITHVSRQIHESIVKYVEKNTLLRGEALENLVTKIEAEVGLNHNYYDLGLTEQGRLAANSAAAVAKKNELYAAVGEAVPKPPNGFETPNLNRVAKELEAEGRQLPGMGGKVDTYLKWAKGEVPMSPELLDQLAGVPAEVREQIIAQIKKESPEMFGRQLDWNSIQAAQKRLSGYADAEDLAIQKGNPSLKGQTTPEGRIYRALAKAAEDDLRLIAESTGSEAKNLLDIADAFFKENIVGVFRKDIIQKMSFSDPAKLIDLAFAPNGYNNIEIVKKALGPEGFANLRDGFTSKLIGDISNPKTLEKNLALYGDEYLKRIYSQKEIDFLKSVAAEGLDLTRSIMPSERFAALLAKDSPSTVIDSILGSVEAKPISKNMYKNIEMMRQILSEKQFNELGEQFYQKIFRVNQQTEMIEPVRLAKIIDKYDERGVLDLFGKDQAEVMREIAKLGNRMAGMQSITGNPSGTAQNALTLGLFGLMIRNPVMGTLNILTLRQLAKILYSGPGIKWLTEGFSLPANSKRGVEFAAKVTGILESDKLSKEQDRHGQFWADKLGQ